MSVGGSPFGSILLQSGQGGQATDIDAGPPPGPPGPPPGPPPLPPGPPGPPPLPASRAVRFRGQIVGHVDPDGVFVRRVHARHILRHPPSIALHVDVLVELVRLGAVAVAYTMDNGSILTGPLELYTGERAIKVDRGGYGPQRAVLLTDFARLELRRATTDDVAAFVAAVGW